MPIVKCQRCSKEFYIKPSHQRYGWGKYCSKACQWKSQFKGKYVRCLICSKVIYRAPKALKHSLSGNFFCNKRCQTIWRNQVYVEEKSYNWKDGERAYRQILKRSGKENKCLYCKNSDERVLAAHHMDHNRGNNNLSNLIWLCYNCHFLVHHFKKAENKLNQILNNNVSLPRKLL